MKSYSSYRRRKQRQRINPYLPVFFGIGLLLVVVLFVWFITRNVQSVNAFVRTHQSDTGFVEPALEETDVQAQLDKAILPSSKEKVSDIYNRVLIRDYLNTLYGEPVMNQQGINDTLNPLPLKVDLVEPLKRLLGQGQVFDDGFYTQARRYLTKGQTLANLELNVIPQQVYQLRQDNLPVGEVIMQLPELDEYFHTFPDSKQLPLYYDWQNELVNNLPVSQYQEWLPYLSPHSRLYALFYAKSTLPFDFTAGMDGLKIAITFDDGPSEQTVHLLNVLRDYHVKGTFFVTGQSIEAYPDEVSDIYEQGHLLGTHSMTHAEFSTLTDAELLDEVILSNQLLEDLIGESSLLYRVPYGDDADRAKALLPNDFQHVMWNVDSLDWDSQNSTMIYNQVVSSLQPESVVLFHDKHPATVEAVIQLIPFLQRIGYEFVSPTDMSFDISTYG